MSTFGFRSTFWRVAAFAAVSLPVFACAWGEEGHRIVAMIAERKLNPHARNEVRTLLNRLHVNSLADIALYMDDARDGGARYQDFNDDFPNNASWHFVNLPLDTIQYQYGAIGTGPNDGVQALRRMIRVLSGNAVDGDPSPEVALWCMTHIAGDLHQPLHTGCGYYQLDNAGRMTLVRNPLQVLGLPFDRGANELIVPGRGKLHAIWDTSLVRSFMGSYSQSQTANYLAGYQITATSGPIDGWPAQWIVDSCRASKRAFTGIRFDRSSQMSDYKSPTGKRIRPTDITLPGGWTTYRNDFKGTVGLQMAKGGARLAELLNAIWP